MKKFTLVFEMTKKGTFKSSGMCEGFTSMEVLGLLYWKTRDVEKQIFGEIKPDIVERTFVRKTRKSDIKT